MGHHSSANACTDASANACISAPRCLALAGLHACLLSPPPLPSLPPPFPLPSSLPVFPIRCTLVTICASTRTDGACSFLKRCVLLDVSETRTALLETIRDFGNDNITAKRMSIVL